MADEIKIFPSPTPPAHDNDAEKVRGHVKIEPRNNSPKTGSKKIGALYNKVMNDKKLWVCLNRSAAISNVNLEAILREREANGTTYDNL
jgi:hypothetical protein